MKLRALVVNTFRELRAKATLLVMAGISTLIIVFMAIAISVHESDAGYIVTLLGNEVSPMLPYEQFTDFVLMMQVGFASALYSGVVLFGVFATASLIPDMLEKGTVDLFLSKPITRWGLLLGKYTGAVTVMFANILYFIGALWLITGLKLGVWNINYLLAAVTMTFTFACLYSLVAFFGTMSRSTGIAIIGAFLYLFIISPLLNNREQFLYRFLTSDLSHRIVDFLYYMLPQISGVQDGVKDQITQGTVNWRPVLQSALSSAVFFLGAAELFKRKDF